MRLIQVQLDREGNQEARYGGYYNYEFIKIEAPYWYDSVSMTPDPTRRNGNSTRNGYSIHENSTKVIREL